MYENPLERLNYYNGMPLGASDFKTEQDYHIRTRRWLNKSLYSAGIARGLEVRAVPPDTTTDNPPRVAVSPGLALDNDGREIILLEDTFVEVCSYAGTSESTVEGNYLVIEYAEETVAYERGGCVVRTAGTSASRSTTKWGGPSRIQAHVKFSWVPFVPQPGSNQIVLAQVELSSPNCDSVHQIDAGARRPIGAASAAMVRQYALEGERHLDKNNPGRIYFHIRGRQPNSVTLYLRAEKFSTLYYTELGRHDHSNSATGFSVSIPEHKHALAPIGGNAGTGPAGSHTPSYNDIRAEIVGALTKPAPWGFWQMVPKGHREASLKIWTGMVIDFDAVPDHWHSIPSETNPDPAKSIPLSGESSSSDAGVSDVPARSDTLSKPEKALTYLDDLHISIGPDISNAQPKRDDILLQLRDAEPTVTWNKLGDGSGNHALALKGTGPIRLDFLPGMSFSEGEYVIELTVNNDSGGRILYNLYVE